MGMRDLPRSGIEPVSPALPGEFLTAGLPGKSLHFFLKQKFQLQITSIQIKSPNCLMSLKDHFVKYLLGQGVL